MAQYSPPPPTNTATTTVTITDLLKLNWGRIKFLIQFSPLLVNWPHFSRTLKVESSPLSALETKLAISAGKSWHSLTAQCNVPLPPPSPCHPCSSPPTRQQGLGLQGAGGGLQGRPEDAAQPR